jgi:hypothetical protein
MYISYHINGNNGIDGPGHGMACMVSYTSSLMEVPSRSSFTYMST